MDGETSVTGDGRATGKLEVRKAKKYFSFIFVTGKIFLL